MPVSDQEIAERYELRKDGVIVFRRVSFDGLPRWARSAEDRANMRVGMEVNFFQHSHGGMVTNLYGCQISETRIRRVLGGAELGRARKSGGGSRAKRERSEAKDDGFMQRVRMGGAVQEVGPFQSMAEFIGWLQETGAEWPAMDQDGGAQ